MESYNDHSTTEVIDLRSIPLHEVTREYSAEGLRQQFLQYVDDLEIENSEKQSIHLALGVAERVHEGQARGEHPYLTHLLRVGSRIINHLGVDDPAIIKAALLHDSVEDRPGKFLDEVDVLGAGDPLYQARAFEVLDNMFGHEVSTLIHAVTNPQFDTNFDVSEQYRRHVAESMEQNAKARIIKMSDFMDNCKGLNHNELPEPQIKRLANKYYPLIPVMEKFTCDATTPLPDKGREYMMAGLERAKERCESITKEN